MEFKRWSIFYTLLILSPVIGEAWKSSGEEYRELGDRRGRGIHYHSKRHMVSSEPDMLKRRMTTQRTKDFKKKPSGHLAPLDEDDIEHDDVVSVAVGPPPRPKYERMQKKQEKQSASNVQISSATNLVKDILIQLGREFLFRQVNEDFVFGQYVGNSMRNLTNELRLAMQHEILELIVKYQKLSRSDGSAKAQERNEQGIKNKKIEKKGNETEETWPDFTNLETIVG